MKAPRFMLVLVWACACVSALVAEEVPAPVPESSAANAAKRDYFDLIREGKVPLKDVLTRLKATGVADKDTTVEGMNFSSSAIFPVACAMATTEEDISALREILAASKMECYAFFGEFQAFGRAYLRLKIAWLKTHPPKLTLPAKPKFGPLKVQVPKKIEEAMRLSAAVQEPYAILEGPITGVEDFLCRDVSDALHEVLARKPGHALTALMQQAYPTAHAVLTYSGPYLDPSASYIFQGIIISLCDDEKYVEAMGALLTMQIRSGTRERGREFTDPVLDFMQACGVNGEAVCLGWLARVYASRASEKRGDIAYYIVDPIWSDLALRGSDQGIRDTLDFIRTGIPFGDSVLGFLSMAAGPYEDSKVLDLVQHLQSRGEPKLALRTEPRRGEIRREILATYATFLDPQREAKSLYETLQELPPTLVIDFEDSLRRLLHHRSHKVASVALERLVAARLVDASEPITPAPAPLRFQLVIPGIREVDLAVIKDDYPMDLAPEIDGRFTVDLADYFDPTELRTLPLHAFPKGEDENRIPYPPITGAVWSGPWFDLEVPVDLQHPQETIVKPLLDNLHVDFVPQRGVRADVKCTVVLEKIDGPRDVMHAEASLQTTPATPVTFARIQSEEYVLSVSGDGLAEMPRRIVVKDKEQRVTVPLFAPHEIRGTAIYPGAKTVALKEAGRLERVLQPGEKPIPNENLLWSVGPGKYRVVVPSTRETPREAEIPSHKGLVREFEVAEDSPATIDLGNSTVEREEK